MRRAAVSFGHRCRRNRLDQQARRLPALDFVHRTRSTREVSITPSIADVIGRQVSNSRSAPCGSSNETLPRLKTLEGIVSKRKDSMYRSGRSPDWLKMQNPAAPAVKREAEEHWS